MQTRLNIRVLQGKRLKSGFPEWVGGTAMSYLLLTTKLDTVQ